MRSNRFGSLTDKSVASHQTFGLSGFVSKAIFGNLSQQVVLEG